MVHSRHVHLSRRERQIMDVLYQQEEASAGTIHESIPDAPSYSAVRALLKKLLDKGHVVYRREGTKYLYRPVLPKEDAKKGAISRLVDTFFDGSAGAAVVNLIGRKSLSKADIEAIEAALDEVKNKTS